jgi:hypothetical protein
MIKIFLILFFFSGLFAIPVSIFLVNVNNEAAQPDSQVVNQDGIELSDPISIQDSLEFHGISEDSTDSLIIRSLDRIIKNNAFSVGEKFTFDIRYGFIKAGSATMEVKDLVFVHDSIPAYRIISTAKSSKGFDFIYKVRDSVESVIDTMGFFSWQFRKQLREGGYKFDLDVNYDQIHGRAYIETIRYHDKEPLMIKKRETFEIPIPKYVIDVLGAFYFVRTHYLETGMPIDMINQDNKKIYNLRVYIQKKERIKVGAGEFDCIMVEPQLKGDAIFKQKGRLWVWLTDDELKIPVKMKSKAFIGSITSHLVKIEGVKKKIKARVK